MIVKVEIVDSQFKHINELCSDLREKDRIEVEKFGFRPFVVLRHSFKNAVYKKTALIEGRVAAMWGVTGSVLSELGHPFLLTANSVGTIPAKTFVTIYLQELSNFLHIYPELENYVDETYSESVKLLRMTGFEFELTKHEGILKFKMSRHNG